MTKRLSLVYSVVHASSIGIEFYFVYLIGPQKNVRVEVCKKKSFSGTKKSAEPLANYF
jgi:hypothetical protein